MRSWEGDNKKSRGTLHVTRDEIFNLRRGKGDRVCERKMLKGEGERGSGMVMWEMRYRLEMGVVQILWMVPTEKQRDFRLVPYLLEISKHAFSSET